MDPLEALDRNCGCIAQVREENEKTHKERERLQKISDSILPKEKLLKNIFKPPKQLEKGKLEDSDSSDCDDPSFNSFCGQRNCNKLYHHVHVPAPQAIEPSEYDSSSEESTR